MTDRIKILMVVAPYYLEIAEGLMDGAAALLLEDGRTQYDVREVPGAFEIPAAIKWSAEKREYAGYLALGCVVRGETSHYDHICEETARALMDLSLSGIPLGNGILTVENQDQARVRADKTRKDKGGEAARAVLRMLELKGLLP